jgi:hypothetical protein
MLAAPAWDRPADSYLTSGAQAGAAYQVSVHLAA